VRDGKEIDGFCVLWDSITALVHPVPNLQLINPIKRRRRDSSQCSPPPSPPSPPPRNKNSYHHLLHHHLRSWCFDD